LIHREEGQVEEQSNGKLSSPPHGTRKSYKDDSAGLL
jgi:hypothetical protein